MGIELKVETHPQFTVGELATQLAESLQGAVDAQGDVLTYQEQSRIERKKCIELEVLTDQIVAFRKNPPQVVSRMEPMMQYDLPSMEEQIKESKDRIEQYNEIVKAAQNKIKRCQQDTVRLQKEIADRRLTG